MYRSGGAKAHLELQQRPVQVGRRVDPLHCRVGQKAPALTGGGLLVSSPKEHLDTPTHPCVPSLSTILLALTHLLHVNLWPPSPRHPGPHGTVHRDCSDARNPRVPDKWREVEVESPEDADSIYPERCLFWCTRRACFGPANQRPLSDLDQLAHCPRCDIRL